MVKLKEEIRYLPVFLVLTCIYFHAVVFNGACLIIGDGFDKLYPLMVTISNQYKNFIFPFWNPYMFSGFPLFGSMEAGAFYPFNIVFPLLFKPIMAFDLNLMLHYSLAGFFTFLYTRQLGMSIFPSLIAGTIFSLLGYLPSHLVHPSIIVTAAWIPLIFYFFERLRQSEHVRDAIFASFTIALQIYAGHPQICFNTCILLTFYLVFHLLYLNPSKRLRFAFLSCFSLAAGFLIALPQIAATYELTQFSSRAHLTYQKFAFFSSPFHLIVTFLFPFFYGGGYGGENWGPTPVLGPEAFAGTLPFVLFIVVLLKGRKNPQIMFWGIAAVLTYILALGGDIPPLHRLLFHVPFYNYFRGPSKHLLETSFALSVLAGFGISALQEREKEKRFNTALIIALSVIIAASLISFTIFHDSLRSFFRDMFSNMHHLQLHWERTDVPEKALSITAPGIYVPVITMGIYLVSIVIFLKSGKKYLRNIALFVIFTVIFIEALLFTQWTLPKADDIENWDKGLYTTLASDTSGRMVFFSNYTVPLIATTYGISLIGGYDQLKIEDYVNLVPTMDETQPAIWRLLIESNSLLSMTNTKYLMVDNVVGNIEEIRWCITRDDEGRNFPAPPVMCKQTNAVFRPIYRKILSTPSATLYENLNVLPRAYPVRKIRIIDSIPELSEALLSFRMNPWYEAALSTEDVRKIGNENFSSGDVKIDDYRPDMVTLSVRFKSTGFVVLADQFYPGWKAYVDGKESKIYKTNGVQRGVIIPAGEHRLVFKYVPIHIYASMIASGLLLGLMLLSLFKVVRRTE